MTETVYILCAIAALLCAWLLARAYRRAPSHLLLWSSVCFVALALNAILVVLDLLWFTQVDLRLLRIIVASTGVFTLLWALIVESK